MSTNRIFELVKRTTMKQERSMQHTTLRLAVTAIAIFTSVNALPSAAQGKPDVHEIQGIAEEAYLYGIPMIVGYKVMHDLFIDRNSG